MELINCHDCGWSVSFSATACPNCGSREPSGSYRFSAREARKLGAEGRNDRNLIVVSSLVLSMESLVQPPVRPLPSQ